MNQSDPPAPLASPCKGICAVNPLAGVCIGCFRTLDEIGSWVDFDAAERTRIMDDLEARETAFWAQMDESED